jgi:serine/threonine-protein kinase
MAAPPAGNTGGASVAAPPADEGEAGGALIGQIIDRRYRILRKLGEGGMGEVYAAEHVKIQKQVAIKLLRNEIVTNKEAVARFEQEARSASTIGHKNIIGIDDLGELPDGRIYMAMELLQGHPLNELIKQPVPSDRLINILIQTGHGLSAAHKKGIVHRDMKPENIFVTRDEDGSDRPKLLDFGIAKVSGNDGNNHLTRTGTIFGTPFYMSPEQALGQVVDHRADIYAVGVIMYEVFCGAVPFRGESFMGILTQHITAEPAPPGQMAMQMGRVLPPGIEQVIGRAMRKDPTERYQSMDELVGDLVRIYRGIAGAGMSGYMHAQGQPVALPGGSQQLPVQVTPVPTPVPGLYRAGEPADDADELELPRRGRAGRWLVIALSIAALGGGVAFFALSRQGGDPSGTAAAGGVAPTAPAALAPTAPAAPLPGAAPVPAAPVAEVAGPAPGTGTGTTGAVAGGGETAEPTAPAPRPVNVIINSRPQGAEVWLGEERVGRTPTLVEVVPGQPKIVSVRRRGFAEQRVAVDGSERKLNVSLERERRGGGKGGRNQGGAGTPAGGAGSGKDTLEDGLVDDPASELE